MNRIRKAQSGKRLVQIVAIVTDERGVTDGTSLGAVVGSKKLKAIAVKGDRDIEVYDAEALRKLNSGWLAEASTTPRDRVG